MKGRAKGEGEGWMKDKSLLSILGKPFQCNMDGARVNLSHLTDREGNAIQYTAPDLEIVCVSAETNAVAFMVC